MRIQLSDLAQVSLNTQITNKVLNTLEAKLDDVEKRDFLTWLTLVRQRIQQAEKDGERKAQRRGGF